MEPLFIKTLMNATQCIFYGSTHDINHKMYLMTKYPKFQSLCAIAYNYLVLMRLQQANDSIKKPQ